ncbi:MAG: protein kinase [Candidatus Solibacter sp.]|nr:protein kinase [Candidatus Solibacter sp.]
MDPGSASEPFRLVETLFHRALAVPDEERESRLAEWCGGDAELLREVRSLVGAFTEAGASGPPPAPDPWIGRQLGHYCVERLLGSGGSGAVYLASRTDGEFHMKVAVKVLASRFTTELLQERFIAERGILASLAHTNIARLIDGGITSAGEVYVVMEYVDGPPLDCWVDQHRPPLDALLRMFLAVCDAVEYAHRNLVLHRDLKPANILVDGEGHPKLLDFGNAKLLGPESSGRLTQLGFRAFTPDFASPEQVLGGPLTAATDVYSLGVILYRLVTGKPPYAFKTYSGGEYIHVLRDYDPPAPSAAITRVVGPAAHDAPFPPAQRRRQLRGDLDAIVMKALGKEADRRYATVAAFAADLRCFLEARPVTARVPTLRYRARKFLWRRRRTVVAALIVAGLFGAGVASTLRAARTARAEEQRANRQFRDVRDLNRALVFEIYDAVQALPGSTEVQRSLVTESIDYIDRLHRESPGDADVGIDVVEAYTRLGNLQGNPYSDNLSDPDRALETLRKALDLARSLARNNPNDRRMQRLMGLAEQGLGEVYFGKRDVASARAHLEEAARLLDAAAHRPPLSAPALAEAASVQGVLGDTYSSSLGRVEDRAKADASFARSEALDREALELDPAQERARRGIAMMKMQARRSMANLRLEAMMRTKLAAILPSIGAFDEGTAQARAALRVYESVASLDPENQRSQVDLANAWYYYAESLDYKSEKGGKRDLEDARRGYGKALAVCQTLLRASPGHSLWSSMAAETEFRISNLSEKLGDRPAAEAAFQRARALAIQIADREDAGQAELARAAVIFSSEDLPAAWRDLPRARRYAARLNDLTGGTSPHYLYTLAHICRLEGKIAEARELIGKAEGLLPAHAPPDPKPYLRRQIEDEARAISAAGGSPARPGKSR